MSLKKRIFIILIIFFMIISFIFFIYIHNKDSLYYKSFSISMPIYGKHYTFIPNSTEKRTIYLSLSEEEKQEIIHLLSNWTFHNYTKDGIAMHFDEYDIFYEFVIDSFSFGFKNLSAETIQYVQFIDLESPSTTFITTIPKRIAEILVQKDL